MAQESLAEETSEIPDIWEDPHFAAGWERFQGGPAGGTLFASYRRFLALDQHLGGSVREEKQRKRMLKARLGSWSRQGFTIMEVLIAVVILVIGLVGVIAMQIVAIQANDSARSTTEATAIAEQFVSVLQQDGTSWTDAPSLSSTSYLNTISSAGQWSLGYGSEPVNIAGVPRTSLPTKGQGRARYCVAYKLHWAVQDEVIGGFVRVYWNWTGARGSACGGLSLGDLAGLDVATPGYSIVTLPLSVRKVSL